MLPGVLQLHLSRIVCYGHVGAAAIFPPLGRQGLRN
jgi:pyridoxal/pyridoxine/pyridoxamine kinase